MARPLTVGDRSPKPGDVLDAPTFGTVRIDASNRPFDAQAHMVPYLAWGWRYLHRADGGPVTVEGE